MAAPANRAPTTHRRRSFFCAVSAERAPSGCVVSINILLHPAAVGGASGRQIWAINYDSGSEASNIALLNCHGWHWRERKEKQSAVCCLAAAETGRIRQHKLWYNASGITSTLERRINETLTQKLNRKMEGGRNIRNRVASKLQMHYSRTEG